MSAEIIREKILLKTDDEVPHSVAVEIENFKENPNKPGLVEIHAVIVVERQSQKNTENISVLGIVYQTAHKCA